MTPYQSHIYIFQDVRMIRKYYVKPSKKGYAPIIRLKRNVYRLLMEFDGSNKKLTKDLMKNTVRITYTNNTFSKKKAPSKKRQLDNSL